jgi:chromosome partitioning protein
MIIVVANSKGGVGKSTLAVHLAAWLTAQGHSVTFADCDAQQSSGPWVAEALPTLKRVRLESSSDIFNQLPDLAAETDYLIADGPGSDTDRTRSLLFQADLAVVPCKASMLEIRALAAATEALRHAQSVRYGQPRGVIVLSMVGKTHLLTQQMKDAAAALGLPLAAQQMTLRQAYADAPGRYAVVSGLGPKAKPAADEVERLFRELLPHAIAPLKRRAASATARRPANSAPALAGAE